MEKTCHGVWENCLRIIKDNVPAQSFKTWFEPIKAITLENKILTIQVPSLFFYEWLEEHYVSLLRRTIKHHLGGEGRLEYIIIMEKADAKRSEEHTSELQSIMRISYAVFCVKQTKKRRDER